MSVDVPTKLAPLEAHGVNFTHASGEQMVGDCPFCSKAGHFYANPSTGQWDCKSCGEEGNVLTFLGLITNCYAEQVTSKHLSQLAKDRGLPDGAFAPWEIGYEDGTWFLPVRSEKGTVWDIRRYDPRKKTIRSTPGCKVQLYGADQLVPENEGCRIWVTEGEWDCIALNWLLCQMDRDEDLVVGVPGAAVFKERWPDLLGAAKPSEILLCYDNDKAGGRGAAKAFSRLDGRFRLRSLNWPDTLPKGYDVRDLIIDGLRAKRSPVSILTELTGLLADTHPAVQAEASTDVELHPHRKKDDPHLLADHILKKHFQHDGQLTLRFYLGSWWLWQSDHYRHVNEKEFRAIVTQHVREALDASRTDRKATCNLVRDVIGAMSGACLLSDTMRLPSWIGEGKRPGTGDLLAMKNGLLDLEGALKDKSRCLFDPTPGWFSLTHWPYDYRSSAHCRKWKRFLKEVLPSSKSRELLQEFLGYSLSFDTSYHKFLVIVGEGANGKSVVTEVATQLIGSDNVTHVGLEWFGDRFSMFPTIGKLLNVASEIGGGKRLAEDTLKAVVSGDMIRVEGKNQQPTQTRPTVRLLFATNDTPKFSDRSEGIWRRLLILPFSVSIAPDKQKPKLAREICERELPGIFNWAIEGLRRLRQTGRFTQSPESRKAHSEHRLASNPAKRFLKECCVMDGEASVRCEELYTAYRCWCEGQGHHPLTAQHFGREVKRVVPKVSRKQLRTAEGREWHYMGLKRLAKKKRRHQRHRRH